MKELQEDLEQLQITEGDIKDREQFRNKTSKGVSRKKNTRKTWTEERKKNTVH